jgi:DNA-binding protein YbaB
MLDKFKDLYTAQKQAKELKKSLKNTHIEAEEGCVIVVIDGEQVVVSVTIKEGDHDKKTISRDMVTALNKAIKKSQQIATEQMKSIMGDDMGGLLNLMKK